MIILFREAKESSMTSWEADERCRADPVVERRFVGDEVVGDELVSGGVVIPGRS